MHVPEALARRIADTRAVAIYGGSAIFLLLLPLITIIHGKAQRPHTIDFVALYVSGQQFRAGGDVYARAPFDVLGPIPGAGAEASRDMHANLNPPATVLLLAPLSRLPYTLAFWTWSLISLLCMAAAAWLLAGAYAAGSQRFVWSIGCLILIEAYSPTWLAISLGQLTFFLLLLLVTGWRLLRANNERGAGAVLGAAVALKPFVGVLAIMLLSGRRWRALRWFCGSFAAVNLIALTFTGPNIFLQYINVLRGVDWHHHIMNASIYGFVARISDSAFGPTLADLVTQVVWFTACIFALGSLAWLCRRHASQPSTARDDIAYAYSLVLMLLLSPLGWIYYFPFLLPCVLVICSEARSLARPSLYWFGAAAGWLISGSVGFLFVGSMLPDLKMPPLVIADIYLAVLVSFAAMLLALGRSQHRSQQASIAS